MNVWEIIIVSFGLALDAFTIAICKGSIQKNLKKVTTIIIGIIFGVIQTLMLALGMIVAIYPMLNIQSNHIILINKWFSALILFYLGIKAIKSSYMNKDVDERREESINYKELIILALATSFDALILGVSLGLIRTNILSGVVITLIVTSILVIIGVWIGYVIGEKYKFQINLCGGIILLIIGIKIILNFFNVI